MGDQPITLDTEAGAKRHLQANQSIDIPSEQQSKCDQPNKSNGSHAEDDGSSEPASKRLKLESQEDSAKVDSRDKVKGVAKIRPEYAYTCLDRPAYQPM